MDTYKAVTYGSIDVYYFDEIDGGGARFGQDYLFFLSHHVGPVEKILEWCAGPAFIGFALLAAGLCEQLTLVDINPAATEACRYTIANNGLEECVKSYTSDCLDEVPQEEMFDLVVANPPHCGDATPHHRGKSQLIYNDVGWRTHRKFYRQVNSHLAPSGRVIIQEYSGTSQVSDFRAMINESGLELRGTFPCATASKYYYIESAAPIPGEH